MPETPGRPDRTWVMRSRQARIAGLLYLCAIVAGWVVLMYIPDRLITTGDAAATAHAIAANDLLFRAGIVGDVVLGVLWLFVVLALYQLLCDVDRLQANLMLILGAFMQVPLYFVNAVNYTAVLLLVNGATYLAPFSEAQRYALAMLFLKLHYYQLLASFLFAGLWLGPFGILVFKSRFLPRVLGVWLVANGIAWAVICIVGFLAPQYAEIVRKATAPFLLGEIAITLWMLVMGARPARLNSQ